MTCAAHNCYNNRKQTGSRISYFRFPLSNKERTQKWLDALNREQYVPTKCSLLCSDHFVEKCFRYNNDRRYLHDNTVPSVFDQRPKKRKAVKKRKAAVKDDTLSEADGSTVQSCCAYGCKESYVKDSPMRFYSFPRDAARREAWTRATRRPGLTPDDTSKLCSRHFTDDSFVSGDRNALRGDAVPTVFDSRPYRSSGKKVLKILPDESEESDEGVAYSAPEYLLEEIPPDIKEEPLDLDGFEDPLHEATPPPLCGVPPPDSKDFMYTTPHTLLWVPPDAGTDDPAKNFVLVPVAQSDLLTARGPLVYLPTPAAVEGVAVVAPTPAKKRREESRVDLMAGGSMVCMPKPAVVESVAVVTPTSAKKRQAESRVVTAKKQPTMMATSVAKAKDDKEADKDAGPVLSMVFVKVEENWDEHDANVEPKLSIVETTSLDRPSSEDTSWTMRLHPATDDVSRPCTPPKQATESGGAKDKEEISRPSSPSSDRSESEPDDSTEVEPIPAAPCEDPLDGDTPAVTPGLLLVGPLAHSEETLAQLQRLLIEERDKNARLQQQLDKERSSKIALRRKLKATEQKLRRLQDKLVGLQLGQGIIDVPVATPVAVSMPLAKPLAVATPVSTQLATPVSTLVATPQATLEAVATPLAVSTSVAVPVSTPVVMPGATFVAVSTPVPAPVRISTPRVLPVSTPVVAMPRAMLVAVPTPVAAPVRLSTPRAVPVAVSMPVAAPEAVLSPVATRLAVSTPRAVPLRASTPVAKGLAVSTPRAAPLTVTAPVVVRDADLAYDKT